MADNNDDVLTIFPNDKTLVQEYIHKEYIINLDATIEDSPNYRTAFQVFRNATVDDTIRIILNTPGGYVSAGIQIANAMLETRATVIAEIYEACSCGALIALHADVVLVKHFGLMMIHTLSSGGSGKQSELKASTDFFDKWNENMIKTVFAGFLTMAEMKLVIAGADMWLDKHEIEKRLKTWVPIRKRKAK